MGNNQRFLMQSVIVGDELIEALKETKGIYWSAHIVYWSLLRLRDNKKRYCSISSENLIQRLHMNRATLFKSLKFLEKQGFVFILRRSSKSNIYFMPLEDYYLKTELLDNYANTIESLGGSLMEWDKYRKEFLK